MRVSGYRRAAIALALLITFGLPGCATHRSPAPTAPPAASSTAPAAKPPQATLPSAGELTDLLNRLADPVVPGAQKLNLIEAAEPTDAGTLDKFITALKGSGYLPLSFAASDVTWSDQNPADAAAVVDITTANPESRGFSFPMEFTGSGTGWQLSRRTAALLLAFGESHRGATPETATTTPGG